MVRPPTPPPPPHGEPEGIPRRTFLEASALAAGVALLEACGREPVQYLVQPLERPEGRPGEGVWKPSVCGQCAAGCGTLVRVVDGDPRKVEGAPGSPLNHGGLCALGQASLQGHYDPDRVTTPLQRAPGGDGAGGRRERAALQPVEWEAALARAAEALAEAAAQDPGSIVFVDGSANRFLHALLIRLASALGAPAPIPLEAPAAEVERRAAARVLGFETLPAYDLPHADYILSIGPAFLDRGHQPVWSTWAMGRVRGGTAGRRGKLVQAESRMSLTAAFADEWLPVVPGQEETLARALAGLLLDAGAKGDADAYRALYPGAPPEAAEAARRCGVPERALRRVAAELASAERPVVLAGGTAAVLPGGLDHTSAALALNLLLGGVGRAGGVFPSASFGLAASLQPQEASAPMSLAALEARLRGIGDPPRVLVVCEGDPLHTRPAGRGWAEGLDRVPTVIALASALDDTAALADVVLPIHSDIERFQATEPDGLPFPALALADPAVKPLGDSRHPGDVVLALAAALDRSATLHWTSFAEMVQELVETSSPRLPGGADGDGGRFFRDALERGGVWGGVPVAGETVAPPAEPITPAADPAAAAADDGFALLLFESPKYGDGRGANKAWLQELPDTLTTVMWSGWAEIASRDAAALGVATGDLVEVTTAHGAVLTPAVVRPEARPGTVAIPLGTGHREYGRYARGRGPNPLDLVGGESVAGTEAAAVSGARAELRRTGEVARVAIFGRGLREAEHIPVGWAPMSTAAGGHGPRPEGAGAATRGGAASGEQSGAGDSTGAGAPADETEG